MTKCNKCWHLFCVCDSWWLSLMHALGADTAERVWAWHVATDQTLLYGHNNVTPSGRIEAHVYDPYPPGADEDIETACVAAKVLQRPMILVLYASTWNVMSMTTLNDRYVEHFAHHVPHHRVILHYEGRLFT